MVRFVLWADALEDLVGLLGVGWLDRDRLEAALKRGILLDILAVLVEGRRADALDLATRERGLEHIGRVDGAFSSTCADERVQLIDEQNDVLGAAHFVHDRLDALFELTAVLGTCHHGGEIKDNESLLVEQIGNLLVHDALSKTLDNRGLSNACFTEEHRVVLGAAAEDLHESLDLVHATNDGIELSALGELGEVAAETVERRSLTLGAAAARGIASRRRRAHRWWLLWLARWRCFFALDTSAEKIEHFLADLFELEAEVHEHLGSDAVVFAQQSEQQVFGADIVVVEAARFLDGVFNHLLGARRLRELAHGDHLGATLDELLHFESNLAEVDVEVLQHIRADT